MFFPELNWKSQSEVCGGEGVLCSEKLENVWLVYSQICLQWNLFAVKFLW